MRIAIRLLTATTLALFVVAIAVAQRGEHAQATSHARNFPGLFEALVLLALLALTALLSGIAAILAFIVALRTKERSWVIAITLSVAVLAFIYLGLFLPNGVLLPVARNVYSILPWLSSFWVFLLGFIPALLGNLLFTIYSFRAGRDTPSPLYMRLGGGNAE